MNDVNFIVALCSIGSALAALAVFWKKAGEIEARILARLDDHEKRINYMEGSHYLTETAHDKLSANCIKALSGRIDEDHANLISLRDVFTEMEKERHIARLQDEAHRAKSREEDAIRWNRLEVSLARMEEWIAGEKDRRRNHE